MSGMVPATYQYNITFYSDATLTMAQMTLIHMKSQMDLDAIGLKNTNIGLISKLLLILLQELIHLETNVPDFFTNTTLPESFVSNLTNEVISNAGATDAYSAADAIATFLRDGNATFDFKRN